MSAVSLCRLVVELIVCLCANTVSIMGSITKKSPFSYSPFSRKAVHWAVDNRITCTPLEHICRLKGTRRDKSVPLESLSLSSATLICWKNAFIKNHGECFLPLFLLPLLLWFAAEWNSWLYLDLLVRCDPDVCDVVRFILTRFMSQVMVTCSVCLWTFQVVMTNLSFFDQLRHCTFVCCVCLH